MSRVPLTKEQIENWRGLIATVHGTEVAKDLTDDEIQQIRNDLQSSVDEAYKEGV